MNSSIRDQLLALAEPTYQNFQRRLLPSVGGILGIRLPKLRRLARKIARGDCDWLTTTQNSSVEETMLEGMVIGYVQSTVDELLHYIRRFVNKLDNWSVCDSFCRGLKIARTRPQLFWGLCLSYLQDTREFAVRFGAVMLLTYYSEQKFLSQTLVALAGVSHEGYYAKMATAWAFSICYARASTTNAKLPTPNTARRLHPTQNGTKDWSVSRNHTRR